MASNTLQTELDVLKLNIADNKMCINTLKTKAMFCRSWRKYDILPELLLQPDLNLEVVEELKLVGFIFRSDLKTCFNTSHIIKKAYKRMWIVRSLKSLGASSKQASTLGPLPGSPGLVWPIDRGREDSPESCPAVWTHIEGLRLH